MNPSHGHLMELLKFLEGQLSDPEAARTQARLNDPEMRRCWQQLMQACEPELGPPREAVERPLTAEMIAAFLEDSLSAADSADVERACWGSPQVLREVVSTYRFLCGSADRAAVPDSLSRRLIELGAVTNSNSPTASPPGALPEFPVSVAAPSGRARRSTATNRATGRRKSHRGLRFSFTSMMLVAAGLFVIMIGLGAAVVLQLGGVDPGNHQVRIPVPQTEYATASPAEPPARRTDPERAAHRENGEPGDVPQQDFAPSVPQIVEHSSGSPSHIEDSVPETPRRATVNHPPRAQATDTAPGQSPRGVPLVLQWSTIDGLVVARDGNQGVWRGARSNRLDPSASNFATLPDSWAVAEIGGVGQMVMSADTQVDLESHPEALQVEMLHGRLAFRELGRGTRLDFRAAGGKHRVLAEQTGTCVALVWDDDRPRVVVRRGAVTVDANRIRQGRQLTLAGGGEQKPEPQSGSTSWMERPPRSSKIPERLQTALLASDDIRGDLIDLRHADESGARAFATQARLAIFPHETFSETLAAADRAQRLETLRWLMTLDTTDPRLRLAWRALAEKSGDQLMVRSVARWKELARRGARLERADAALMVRGLNHDMLAFRQISAHFLELAFGRRVAYQPDASVADRRRAIREWTQVLRQFYGVAADRP